PNAADLRGLGAVRTVVDRCKNQKSAGLRTVFRGPRIIATNRQAPRIYPRMIPLCSRFDSVLFTPKMSAIASCGNYSRFPKAVASTGRLDDGRFALLAPCTPRVMIRTHVGGVAKIDVCALVLSHLSDLRVFRLQPFLHLSLITLQRSMQRLLRRDAKLGQQATNRVRRQRNA